MDSSPAALDAAREPTEAKSSGTSSSTASDPRLFAVTTLIVENVETCTAGRVELAGSASNWTDRFHERVWGEKQPGWVRAADIKIWGALSTVRRGNANLLSNTVDDDSSDKLELAGLHHKQLTAAGCATHAEDQNPTGLKFDKTQ